VLVALASGWAAAWACVPQPLVTVKPQASGPAGSQVTISSTAVSGSAEVRWNAVDGPSLATATGPDFSVPITIPASPDGLYSVVVLGRRADGSVGPSASAPFLVTSPGASPALLPRPKTAVTQPSTSESLSVPVAAAGGVGLLVVGAVVGALVTRRRRSAPAVKSR